MKCKRCGYDCGDVPFCPNCDVPEKSELPPNCDVTYKIVRYHFKGEKEVVVRGLTLAQAQARCEREDTHGDGWFDGYTKE